MGLPTIIKLLYVMYSLSIVFPKMPAFNNSTLSCRVLSINPFPIHQSYFQPVFPYNLVI